MTAVPLLRFTDALLPEIRARFVPSAGDNYLLNERTEEPGLEDPLQQAAQATRERLKKGEPLAVSPAAFQAFHDVFRPLKQVNWDNDRSGVNSWEEITQAEVNTVKANHPALGAILQAAFDAASNNNVPKFAGRHFEEVDLPKELGQARQLASETRVNAEDPYLLDVRVQAFSIKTDRARDVRRALHDVVTSTSAVDEAMMSPIENWDGVLTVPNSQSPFSEELASSVNAGLLALANDWKKIGYSYTDGSSVSDQGTFIYSKSLQVAVRVGLWESP